MTIIIVFQCPAAFTPTPRNKRNLRRFFENIRRRGHRFAWEPRSDWRAEEVRRRFKKISD